MQCRARVESARAAGVSGVIAVVVLGLAGSASGKWSMSAAIVESGTFDVFWDTLSFCVNGAPLRPRPRPRFCAFCRMPVQDAARRQSQAK